MATEFSHFPYGSFIAGEMQVSNERQEIIKRMKAKSLRKYVVKQMEL